MTAAIAPGTRIRFRRVVIEPACGDHPEFLLAENGERGEVVQHIGDFGDLKDAYSVRADGCRSTFVAQREEFEVVEDASCI